RAEVSVRMPFPAQSEGSHHSGSASAGPVGSNLMNTLSVDLPAGLRAEASRRGVSEAAWLEEAAREKLAATKDAAYLAERGGRDKYLRVLGQAPAVPPEPGGER